MEIICTEKSRIGLTKELRNNNVNFEFGVNLWRVIVIDSPKSRMAIKMTQERCGLQSLKIVKS